MVGGKSLGCATCRKRKVKCDGRFPKCANCERGGRQCGGPKSQFVRFVKPGTEEHIKKDQVSDSLKILTQPTSDRSQLLAFDLIHRLTEVKEEGFQLQQLGGFYSLLPSRVGHNPALDSALKCILLAHKNFLGRDKSSKQEDVKYYDEAVSLVRRDLERHQSKTSSETLCASMILGTYEMFTGELRHSWVAHAGGVTALIEAWGPERIVTDFDLILFITHYGAIVMSSILSGKECFLTSPAWDALRVRILESSRLDGYFLDILTSLATLPPLVRGIREIRSSSLVMPDAHDSSLFNVHLFKARLTKHAAKLQSDLQNPSVVFEKTTRNLELSHTMYEFCDQIVAFRYTLYWASIIIANTMFVQLGVQDVLLNQETQDAADHICKSIDYMGSFQPFGAMPTTFSISRAYGVSDAAMRIRLVDAIRDLFKLLPFDIGPIALQHCFNMITGWDRWDR